MKNKEFKRLCKLAFNWPVKRKTPIDTGNLRNNALKLEFSADGKTCKIWVDESIAYYMPYTNEKWISPKWRGKQNPNQNWWQRAAERVDAKIVEVIGEENIATIKTGTATHLSEQISKHLGINL